MLEPLELADGAHVMDRHLGEIHAIAGTLAMHSQHGLAIPLAEAHEALQNYIIQQDEKAEALIRREEGVEIGPIIIGPGPWYARQVPLCPSCNSLKVCEDHRYCPTCGNRLKWPKEKV